ncbi:MAG: DNA methyltransferase, partial [Spirochaetota bacterium]
MDAIKISKESVGNINNKEDLVNLIATLGYKTDPSPLNVSEFDLPETARKLIKDLHIISDYYKKFQIYFGKTTSMRRTDFRNILEPFYRRYPQVNTLFVFTEDWKDLAFVSPLRVEIEPRKVRPRLRILFIDPANVYHTDFEVLQNIFIYPEEQNPEVIWQKHLEAFNVERVTKEFFEAYKNALRFIKDILEAQKKSTRQGAHSFAQQLLSRIMFLYFVQKKGWMKRKDYFQEKRYIKYLWESYKGSHAKKDTFYSLWLSSLFFQAFNKNHGYLTSDLPEEIKESFGLMPFLNGGLFTKNELDNIGFEVPDEVFSLLFDIDPLNRKKGFLERYNFTIREDTPLEVEVAVDPEMLGKVYESLISEEERGKSGIFYTPRVEIDYMCRLSLVEYLFEKTAILKASIIPLIFEPHTIMEYSDIESLRKIREAIEEVKVVDPAVGSASFLVGMTNVLVDIMKYLSLRIDGREENLFALKNKVLSENLYGVDVKDWAVMVGELRLWLSLIIETEEREMDIYTHPLLPNLTFKIRQGDSLIEEIAGIPISLRGRFGYIPKIIKDKIITLIDKKAAYFSGMRSADLKEKHEIEDLENEIFKDIIVNEIKRLQEEKKKIEEQLSAPRAQQIEMFGFKPDQKDLFEEETRKLKEKLPGIKKDEEHLKTLLSIIGKKSKDIGYGTALQEFLLKRMEPV